MMQGRARLLCACFCPSVACKTLLFLMIVTVLPMVGGCGESEAQSGYIELVRNSRAAKDRAMTSADSPLLPSDRSSFGGLKYYPPDSAWRVDASYEPYAVADTVTLGTSTGEMRNMARLGRLTFTHPNRGEVNLTLYAELEGSDGSFLPFSDGTNGEQTYYAGRYLDVSRPEGEGTIELDFNYAYNPYCAYNEQYSCPLVPPENQVAADIPAGERSWR